MGRRGSLRQFHFDDVSSFSPVPGGSDGPSGVLVCCENYLVYKNFGDQPDLRCPIPRRKVCKKREKEIRWLCDCFCPFLSPQHDLDDAERSMLFVCSATHKTKVRAAATLMSCAPTLSNSHSLSLAHVLLPGPN